MKSLPSDISIAGVEINYEHHAYRTPLEFGGVPVTHAVLLNVRLRARARTGVRRIYDSDSGEGA